MKREEQKGKRSTKKTTSCLLRDRVALVLYPYLRCRPIANRPEEGPYKYRRVVEILDISMLSLLHSMEKTSSSRRSAMDKVSLTWANLVFRTARKEDTYDNLRCT